MSAASDSTFPAPIDQARIDGDLDRALRTLSLALAMHSISREPVLLRSVELAFLLRGLGYGRDVQVAGLLHDLLNETKYPLHDIAHDFGDEVAVLIMANTFDAVFEDAVEQYEEASPRCIAWGESAAVIMAASLYQASAAEGMAVLPKVRRFLELSRTTIGDQSIWKRLQGRMEELEGADIQHGEQS